MNSNFYPALEDRMRIFLQANQYLKDGQSMVISAVDVLEMIELFRTELLDNLIAEEENLPVAGTVTVGGYKKYKDDTGYHHFWDDVVKNVTDVVETCFLREIKLASSTKISCHPMCKRFCSLFIPPIIDYFREIGPQETISTHLDKVFSFLEEAVLSVEVKSHSTDIEVARQLLKQTHGAECNKGRRLQIIKRVAEKLRVINTDNDNVEDLDIEQFQEIDNAAYRYFSGEMGS